MTALKPPNSVVASAPNKDAFPSVDPLDREFDEIAQSEKSPELKSGIGPVVGPRASVVAEAQAEPIDDVGDEFPTLFRVLEM